jgi:hypothetical protein
MTEYHIGDKVKFTFLNTSGPDGPEWFGAEIVNVEHGHYRGILIDRGTSTSYTDQDVADKFETMLGDGRSLTLYSSATPVEFPDLIGRAPKPVQEPLYVGPFEARDDRVVDGIGRRIVLADGVLSDYQDDRKLAQVMAAALNAYFGD